MKIEDSFAVWTGQPRRVMWTVPWKQNEKQQPTNKSDHKDNREEIKRHEFSVLKVKYALINVQGLWKGNEVLSLLNVA